MNVLLDLSRDIWDFLRIRKKYWLAPLIITVVLMGLFIIIVKGTMIAPFIYALF